MKHFWIYLTVVPSSIKSRILLSGFNSNLPFFKQTVAGVRVESATSEALDINVTRSLQKMYISYFRIFYRRKSIPDFLSREDRSNNHLQKTKFALKIAIGMEFDCQIEERHAKYLLWWQIWGQTYKELPAQHSQLISAKEEADTELKNRSVSLSL